MYENGKWYKNEHVRQNLLNAFNEMESAKSYNNGH